MGTISKPNTFTDATPAEASEVNDNFDAIYNEFNGNISAANLATNAITTAKISDSNVTTAKIADSNVTTAKIADGNVTNAKLATGAGQPGGAWTSFTPTLSGRLNDSKWTKTCSYTQIGKTVHYKLELVASSATPMDGGTADAIFTLPVTSISYVGNPTIGDVRCLDSGTAAWYGFVEYVSTTTAYIRLINAAATYAQPGAITSTVPFTWTTSDQIIVIGTYEAA